MAHDRDSSPPPFAPPHTERCFYALLLLRRGFTLEEIASVLPNGAKDGQPGVSIKSAEIILRQGARLLLAGLLLGRPAPSLPQELWPPEDVRERILEQRTRSYRTMLAYLKAWLESLDATAAETSLQDD